MSLLLDHGHPNAWFYPIGRVGDEVRIVLQRVNRAEVTRALLIQAAGASIMSKSGGEHFSALIKNLLET